MQLIFVYNADSGLLNAGKDFLHKTLRPATYPCRLCDLTYGAVRKKPEWAAFVKGLGVESRFEYRDTLATRYGISGVPLPAIFIQTAGEPPRLWIDAETLNGCRTLAELTALVKALPGGEQTPDPTNF